LGKRQEIEGPMAVEQAANEEQGWTASTRPQQTSRGLATELSRGERRAYVHTRVFEAEGGRAVSILFDDRGRLVGAFREQPAQAALPLDERLRRQHAEIVDAVVSGRVLLP